MWTCTRCFADVDDSLPTCWSCGAARDVSFDPETGPASTEEGFSGRVAVPVETHTLTDLHSDTQVDVPGLAGEAAMEQPAAGEPPLVIGSKEDLLALESQLSCLMDQYDVPDWTVNPAHHPDVNAFIARHAGNEFFHRKALALQTNRARYYETMRARQAERAAQPAAAGASAPNGTEAVAPQVPGATSSPTTDEPPTRRSCWDPAANWRSLKRLLRWTVYLVLLLIGVVLGVSLYFHVTGEKRLREAIAEADQMDPGWRWDDLQASRPAWPDEQPNGALQVEAAARLIPADARTDAFLEQIDAQPPNAPLNPDLSLALNLELSSIDMLAAVSEARELVEYPGGRWPARTVDDLFSGKPHPAHDVVRVAKLLRLHAAQMADFQLADPGLTDARATLNAGRAIGDEPDLIAQLARMSCQHFACRSIERTLAQGQPSAGALAETQHLLEDEAKQPLLWHALRGQRAHDHEALLLLETNDVQRLLPEHGDKAPAVFASQSTLGRAELWLKLGWIKDNHGLMLEWMNQAVEAARLPPQEQGAKFQALKEQSFELRGGTLFEFRNRLGTMSMPGVLVVTRGFHTRQAELRCTMAALAAERYRREHGRWPESLQQLAPRYLGAVPLDPFDNQPLRFRRLWDGLIIYSVGPDGDDQDGELMNWNDSCWQGTDIGFRLWDVACRRAEPLPMPSPLPDPQE